MGNQQYMESSKPGQPFSTASESILKAPRAYSGGVLEVMAISTIWLADLLLLSVSNITDFDAHANCPLQLIPSRTCKLA